jgi:hypothetical protein
VSKATPDQPRRSPRNKEKFLTEIPPVSSNSGETLTEDLTLDDDGPEATDTVIFSVPVEQGYASPSDLPSHQETTAPATELPAFPAPPVLRLRRKSQKGKENTEPEPKHLKHDFDLIDYLHACYGHCSAGRLRKLILAMNPDDPARPNVKTLHHWSTFRKCRICSNADMERPNQDKTHPATKARFSGECKPGSHLTIDGSGAFRGPTRSGMTQAFLFTDAFTSYRSARPTTDKTCLTLVNEVKT